MLRFLGADVKPVPAVAFDNPNNYNHQARRHAESLPNAIWGNQFDNTANKMGHYLVLKYSFIDIYYSQLDLNFGNKLMAKLMVGQ